MTHTPAQTAAIEATESVFADLTRVAAETRDHGHGHIVRTVLTELKGDYLGFRGDAATFYMYANHDLRDVAKVLTALADYADGQADQ